MDQCLATIKQTCVDRMEHITTDIAKDKGVTENLKAIDQLEWVGRMNNICNREEEIILLERVYSAYL